MDIQATARDPFPKLGLKQIYIGDLYPLCVDKPRYHFLKRGAKYRLLAGSSSPELQNDPASWEGNSEAIRVNLPSNSHLYDALCNYQDDTSSCSFPSVVTIDTDLTCIGIECDVDTVRVVEVIAGIFYEYISLPCVQQAFYNGAVKLTSKSLEDSFCSDTRNEVASAACCDNDDSGFLMQVRRDEKYWGERMTYATAEDRCHDMGLSICNVPVMNDCGDACNHNVNYWTSQPCALKVKVNPENGKIALIHDSQDDSDMDFSVSVDSSITYFSVIWQDQYPTPENSCGGSGYCEVMIDRCVCAVSVEEMPVFTTMPEGKDEILNSLKTGAYDPTSLDYNYSSGYQDYKVHKRDVEEQLSMDTIFEMTADNGVTYFLKNIVSTVKILGSAQSMSFPNPPHFMNLPDIAKRDALFETEAALDHYLFNENTAPFLVTQLIKRFGNSNPSPRYVLAAASAFRSGQYTHKNKDDSELSFGSGKYGDLSATVAAILLDPEARNVLLDADPSHGSVREPFLKIIALLKSFKVQGWKTNPLIQTRLMAFTRQISQEPYEAKTVFSYFNSEFQSSGSVMEASLVAPEAQLLTGPNTLNLVNGLFSLIKYGITSAHGGFFHQLCGRHLLDPGDYQCSQGLLTYVPSVNTATGVVDEISTLMTSGRLSSEARNILVGLYNSVADKNRARMMVQQLIATTPEFHTTGTTTRSTESRPELPFPTPSEEPYKAVVYVFLIGGADSYNILVPSCEPLKTAYKQARKDVALSDAELLPISTSETGQVCNDFAIHHKLKHLHDQYNKGQVIFFANTGLLSEKVNRTNASEKEKSILFAHNRMAESTEFLDPFKKKGGKGILGRLTDALSQLNGKTSGKKYKVGSFSIDGFSTALVGTKDKSPSTAILNLDGATKFDPYPWTQRTKWKNVDLLPYIQQLNQLSIEGSSVFGRTWSSDLLNFIDENGFLASALEQINITTHFEEDNLSVQLKQVAKLIKSKDIRGVDRDVFYTTMYGFDHHADLMSNTNELFPILDYAIESFWKEMDDQNRVNDVILVAVSEFGRTLFPNSSNG